MNALNLPDVQVKLESECLLDGDEDTLIANAKRVYAVSDNGMVVINGDGMSDEDRVRIDAEDSEIRDEDDE